MFEANSRYANQEELTYRWADGEERRYIKRRFLPQPESQQIISQATIAEGQRLDHISARAYGDPTMFWRLCDANNSMKPEELEEPNTSIKIPIPQAT